MSIGPYALGDNPATPVLIDILTSGEEDLTAYTDATLTLRDGGGLTVSTIGPIPVEDEDDGDMFIQFRWATPFTSAGLFSLTPVLSGAGHVVTLPSIPVVVEAPDGWHTLASARADWRQAPQEDVTLYNLLANARTACESYAPALPEHVSVPSNYRAAQLMQARDSLNANTASTQDQDPGSYISSRVAMTWKVQALLRPKRRMPALG